MKPMIYRVGLSFCLCCLFALGWGVPGSAAQKQFSALVYDTGTLKPFDSALKVQVGDIAPDFELPAISGKAIRLSAFRGKKNVVISFVPAAWTPVCSDQWPGYGISRTLFEQHDATLLGISVDNVPTLHAWIQQMGNIWFEVLSDFWPHGEAASKYGVLRGDGTAERALIFIDRQGRISGLIVSDINARPPLESIVKELEKMN
jgi:peroxiredoxin